MADSVLTLFELTFCLCAIVCAPGFPIKRFRPYLSGVFLVGTCVCYILSWLWCLIVLAMIWGALPVIVGLVLGIVGVVPVAIVLLLFSGHWALLLNAVLMLAGATALRVGYHYFKESVRALALQKVTEHRSDHVLEAQEAWDRASEAMKNDPTKQVPY